MTRGLKRGIEELVSRAAGIGVADHWPMIAGRFGAEQATVTIIYTMVSHHLYDDVALSVPCDRAGRRGLPDCALEVTPPKKPGPRQQQYINDITNFG
jgi:hypothetical protein